MDAGKFLAWNESVAPGARRVDLGRIVIPSGRLAFRDPYEYRNGYVALRVSPGNYEVWSTEVDEGLGFPERAGVYLPAYLSIRLSAAEPDWVAVADELADDEVPSYGLWTGADHGLVAAHDADALEDDDLPSLADDWDRALNAEDNPHRFSYTNVPLPGDNNANIILSRSGQGDGAFEILASYDNDGRPVAIHVDFGVVDTDGSEEAAAKAATRRERRWTARLRRMFTPS
ncbi:DUF4241 domain-containing protein [Mycobacteroides abscessus]|uniref:DUF4241 domain-containing protein n=1 Tax=Mycobacteroides abscessus TaxID=36809 RepID=UPI000C2613C8|nr:DUF4241 domain-containing protein [Mycobacteroides abscessus]